MLFYNGKWPRYFRSRFGKYLTALMSATIIIVHCLPHEPYTFFANRLRQSAHSTTAFNVAITQLKMDRVQPINIYYSKTIWKKVDTHYVSPINYLVIDLTLNDDLWGQNRVSSCLHAQNTLFFHWVFKESKLHQLYRMSSFGKTLHSLLY